MTLEPGRGISKEPTPITMPRLPCRTSRTRRAERRGRRRTAARVARVGVVVQHGDQRDVAGVDVEVHVEEVARLDVVAVAAPVAARHDRAPHWALRNACSHGERTARPAPRPRRGVERAAGMPPRPSAPSPRRAPGGWTRGRRRAPRRRARARRRVREPRRPRRRPRARADRPASARTGSPPLGSAGPRSHRRAPEHRRELPERQLPPPSGHPLGASRPGEDTLERRRAR